MSNNTLTYNINKYFSEEECYEIIDYCMENGVPFKYNESENWDCRLVNNKSFKEKIIKKFIDLNKIEVINVKYVNISLTRYYDGRYLNLHTDTVSQFTTVIVLTKDFEDGRFVLSKIQGKDISDMREDSIKITLNIGEGVSFEGSKTYHGVMPVHKGIRCALNVWISKEKIKKEKTLL
jgi:Rps23 Pro-64 3,4-dihydroxylase Tpa1-like proline 4-hydroxylase